MKQEIFRNIWGVPEIFDLTYFYERNEDLIEMYYSNTSQGERGYLFMTHNKNKLPKFYEVYTYERNEDLIEMYYSNISQGERGYLFMTHNKNKLPKFYEVYTFFQNDNLYAVYDYIIDRFLRESED